MKTTLKMWCAAALSLVLASCFEHTAKIRVEKDGSGTVTEETLFGAEVSAMLGSVGGGEDDPLSKMTDKAKAEETAKKLGEGVTVAKVEKIDEKGRKGARVVYAFKDINQLKYVFGQSMGDMGGEEVEAEKKKAEDGPVTFSFKDGVLTVKTPKPSKDEDKEEGAEEEEMGEQELAMAQAMFKEMKMSMTLEVAPGIEETTATHREGDVVTLMSMEFGKLVQDPEKFRKFAKLKPETPAEMEKALEGVEGVKVETKEEITIKLK